MSKSEQVIIFLSMALCLVVGSVAAYYALNQDALVATTDVEGGDGVLMNDVSAEVSVSDRSDSLPVVLYALNVHDWSHPDESAETVRRVVGLHETYDVPVEVFLSDPVYQLYLEEDPELMIMLKTSPVVSVSYHIRPPVPYYSHFDWLLLSEMRDKDRHEILLSYEEHRLNLETGEVLEDPGGYDYLAEYLGYAPRIVGMFDRSTGGQLLADIYLEKGATFFVKHGTSVSLGDELYGAPLRPEQYDLKLYEYAEDKKSAEDIFSSVMDGLVAKGQVFIGVKYHETNFYHADNPWFPVFWVNGRVTEGMLIPPFDLGAYLSDFRTELDAEMHWQLYEGSLQYISGHSEMYQAMNAVGLMELLED